MINTIRKAIEVLAGSGWAKGTFCDDERRHCIQGALYEVHGLLALDDRPMTGALTPEMANDVALVNGVIEAQYPERFGAAGVARFNDHPETTIDDVITVLEKAAIRKDERI